MKLAAIVVVVLGAVAQAAPGPFVVSGATGRTGSKIYDVMKRRKLDVRAFVRNVTKARILLKCTKCDESEGIFVGDITEPDTMKSVMAGASALVIASSAEPTPGPNGTFSYHKGAEPIDIDWKGAKNQLQAFAERSGADGRGHIALISTMGTQTPEDAKDKGFMDYISFYKLNFEAALMSSGVPFTIVKPCALDIAGTEPGVKELVTGHDNDLLPKVTPPAIARGDVARVMVAAVEQPQVSAGLHFDLCAESSSTPTTDADLGKVVQSARFPWEQPKPLV